LIKYAQLKMMKPSAFIINLGRGGIINEEDLVRALNENVIAGAGIDVYSKEPIPLSSPYLKIKDNSKVIFTPHIGWTSQEARKCLINKLSENITSEVN
ncbi:MAG: NAD(P)-dependent oxidoreductase, partial [Bacteroidales bacterium]|nr:NAD(P)-dependent oxidoreductase [Bacteroidales bacterium]